MSTKKNYAGYAIATVVGLGIAQTKMYLNQIGERFPEFPPNIRRRAYFTLIKRSVQGKYRGYNMDDDAVIDMLFVNICHELTA